MHDLTVDRVTDGSGKLAAMTWTEVKESLMQALGSLVLG
jgi:glycerophosphoryl diester phosphodiesterase